MSRGHHEAARREFDEAQRLRPQDPEVLLNLSITLFHLGQFGPAEEKTRELLQEHDDSVPLLFNLGLILFKSVATPRRRSRWKRSSRSRPRPARPT